MPRVPVAGWTEAWLRVQPQQGVFRVLAIRVRILERKVEHVVSGAWRPGSKRAPFEAVPGPARERSAETKTEPGDPPRAVWRAFGTKPHLVAGRRFRGRRLAS